MELTDTQKIHYDNLSEIMKQHTATFLNNGFDYDRSYMRALEERMEELIQEYESKLDYKDAQIEDMIVNNNIPQYINDIWN